MDKYSIAREQAKRLLVGYFRTVFTKAGLQFDKDNVAEIEDIVDSILDAAKEPVHHHVSDFCAHR